MIIPNAWWSEIRTYDRTEGRKNWNRKVAETWFRPLLVSDGVREQINHKGRLQDDASSKKELHDMRVDK